ncbi:MAG: dihydroorotase [Deltaproteobacteria bacterium]|nr:MAG: dihydroorotase [Deltaproteobacteria bacterium]
MILKGGTVFDPATGTRADLDILIEEERIGKVGPGLATQFHGEESFDCADLWIFPGLVDMHTHLREPGYEYKETIRTGTQAAAAGGFTTIACMANTLPVNDTASVTRYIREKADEEGIVEVLPVGAATKGLKGEQLAEIGLMREAGIVALSDDGFPIRDGEILRLVLEYARRFNLLVIDHCEDLTLTKGGVAHEGKTGTRMGLRGSPSVAESIMVARDILMARWLETPVHIAHVSCRESIDIIRWAKEQGIPVTCETTPHHLSLTTDDLFLSKYDTNFKVNPPLRDEEDRKALLAALKDGVIDCIATDHAPHDTQSKLVEFDYAANGISGLETALPIVFEVGSLAGISPLSILSRLTVEPARILGIERGTLSPGSIANLVIFDPAEKWVVAPENFFSKGKNSPFAGRALTGRVKATLFHGKAVFLDRNNPWGLTPVCERKP